MTFVSEISLTVFFFSSSRSISFFSCSRIFLRCSTYSRCLTSLSKQQLMLDTYQNHRPVRGEPTQKSPCSSQGSRRIPAACNSLGGLFPLGYCPQAHCQKGELSVAATVLRFRVLQIGAFHEGGEVGRREQQKCTVLQKKYSGIDLFRFSYFSLLSPRKVSYQQPNLESPDEDISVNPKGTGSRAEHLVPWGTQCVHIKNRSRKSVKRTWARRPREGKCPACQ